MREFFELYKPNAETKALIRIINDIISDYQSQGFTLTLRQLYYQLVSKDLIKNEEKQYKRIGDIVSRGRRGGHFDWDAIEDRVRRPRPAPQFDSLQDLVDAALHSYRLPRLKGQDTYVELWVEKDALAGVLQPIATEYHVTMMVNRGYSSSSAMKEAGERMRKKCVEIGATSAIVLYLGDLDPSGEDMVRDVDERVNEYTNSGIRIDLKSDGDLAVETNEEFAKRCPHIDFSVEKLALTMDQVDEYDPPPNPAKLTDSRAAKFVEKYGDSSWEVDALPPTVLRDIIESRLEELFDDKKISIIRGQEEVDKTELRKAVAKIMKRKRTT